MVYKRTYQLRSPDRRKRPGAFAWGSEVKLEPMDENHSAHFDSGRDGSSGWGYGTTVTSVSGKAGSTRMPLITRAQLLEELSNVDVEEPTLSCCGWCSPRIHKCSRRWLPLFRPTRVTSLFWMEKALVLVDTMQVFALLWAMSLAWPWPKSWAGWSRWTLVFNMDTVSMSEWEELMSPTAGTVLVERSVWGELPGDYMWLWLGWAIAVVAVPVTWFATLTVLRINEEDWQQFRSHLRNVAMVAFQVMYLPAQLALGRAFSCEQLPGEAQSRLSVDPQIKCGGATHTILVFFSMALFGGMLAAAGWLAKRVHRHALYDDPELHDRHLRWKEAEYVHGLDQEWLASSYWLWSSFRRRHVYHWPSRMVLKTLLVLVFVLLGGSPALQVDVAFVLLLVWATWESIVPTFRCWSTQLMCTFINWVLVTDAVAGSIRAHNMRTALNVDNRYTIAISTVNGVCTLLVGGVLVVSAWSKRIGWPAPSPATASARSMTSKERRAQYSVEARVGANGRAARVVSPGSAAVLGADDEPEIPDDVRDELEWVSALMRARAEVSQAQLSTPELVDVTVLDATVHQLRGMWREAKAAKHVLAWSMVDAMDQVSALAEACRPNSYLPNSTLATLLPDMVHRLRRRSERLALVSPQIRRIFLKLLAFRSWIGDRVFERVDMGQPGSAAIRYYFNPFSVTSKPPTVGAVGVMSATTLLREMPAILKARPTGHPKVTHQAPSDYDARVELMRCVQRRWAEVLLEYERSFTVQNASLRARMRESTEVAAWYAAARQVNAIVRSIDHVDEAGLQPLDSGEVTGDEFGGPGDGAQASRPLIPRSRDDDAKAGPQ